MLALPASDPQLYEHNQSGVVVLSAWSSKVKHIEQVGQAYQRHARRAYLRDKGIFEEEKKESEEEEEEEEEKNTFN
jgi:predicted RecB family nuclease